MRRFAIAAAAVLAAACTFEGAPASARDATVDAPPPIDAPLPACADDIRYDRSAGVPVILRVEVAGSETWDSAKTICDGEGAMLAVLKDQAARDHANSLAPGTHTWIGYRAIEPLLWRWEDGTMLEVVRGADGWASSRPDRVDQDCARINQDGEFDDEPCTDTEDFICQCAL